MSKHEFSFTADAAAEAELVGDVLSLWKTPPRLPLDRWAEEHYTHEVTGRFRPLGFQRGLLRAFGDKKIPKCTFLKAARIGASMSLAITTVYHAAADPLRVGYLLSTMDDCNGFSSDILGPSLENSAVSRDLLTAASRDTLTHKIYGNGGVLKLLAANSARSLRRHDLDACIADECDSYPLSAGQEGNPVDLFFTRSRNSHRRKLIIASTPTLASTSEIWKHWLESDQRHYYVKCPHCGHEQTIEWENLMLVGFDKETGEELVRPVNKVDLGYYKSLIEPRVVMQCVGCKEHITEDHKANMVENGRWIAHAPEVQGHAGFSASTLLSTFPAASWQGLILEWCRARDPQSKMVFVNTVLGRVYEDAFGVIEPEELAKRKHPGSLDLVPEDVLVITAGIDVQKDRVEITRLGWSPSQVYVLDHRKLYGDPTGGALWASLDAELARTFQHPLGNQIGTTATAIDAGNWSQQVYSYCAGKQARGIYAIKGVGGPKPIWAESKVRPGQGAKLYLVGVDQCKLTTMQYLSIDDQEAEGYVHFSTTGIERATLDYFEELTSEVQSISYKAGKPVTSWVRKKGLRAEALDAFCYALAARHTLSPNWQMLREQLTAAASAESGYVDFSDI